MKKVLMLSSAEKTEDLSRNDGFVESLNARLHDAIEVAWCNYGALVFEFTENGTDIYIRETQKRLDEFDFIYFKSVFRHAEISTVIARYLKAHGVPFVCREHLEHQPVSKLSQLDRLGSLGLSIPRTLYVTPGHWGTMYDGITEKYGTPFILKAIDGLRGAQNYLVNTQAEYEKLIATNEKTDFIAEEFLSNNGDYRVLVLGGEVELIIERTRRADQKTHLNNTSQGAQAQLVNKQDFDQTIQRMSVRASQVLERDVAGVDVLIRNTDSKPFILEVNASPQISSGAFVDEKLDIFAAYLRKNVMDVVSK